MRNLLLVVLLVGCAHQADLFSLAYKDGPRVVACAAEDYRLVDQALRDGKVDTGASVVDWLGFAATTLQCAGPVITDLIKAARGTPVAGPAPPSAVRPTRAALRRALHLWLLCRASGLCDAKGG